MERSKSIILIGYQGHAYVICDIFNKCNDAILGYCERSEKVANPFKLNYLGDESAAYVKPLFQSYYYFIGVGDNRIRRNIYQKMSVNKGELVNAIHPTAILSREITLDKGIMIGANAIINALATVGKGVICNTGSIIEHECTIGNFAHIAPGTVLCGNVTIGENSFIGANSVVRQGITIGSNVVLGAGSVVVKDIPDNVTYFGNPAKLRN